MGCGARDFCRILFKKLKILQLISQYLLSLLIFVVNNRDHFLIKSEIHNIITSSKVVFVAMNHTLTKSVQMY